MKHYTELTIAGFPVEVTIEYSIEHGTYNADRVVIPTYDEWMKNPDNTEADYKLIQGELNKERTFQGDHVYDAAYWKLVEEIGIEESPDLTHKDRMKKC